MNLEIESYQDWMKSQVSELFSMQYLVDKNDFAKLIDNFYDHPYQKNKCIRVVAKEGNKIVGFQSFFHWPYTYRGKIYNSYQSGNSLVHPDYRGKGIFQNLLNFVDDKKDELAIDFLMGFPVEESKNSFIRNNWNNILNLSWYVKVVNPFSFLFPLSNEKIAKELDSAFQYYLYPSDAIQMLNPVEFTEWRKLYSGQQHYFYHQYKENNNSVCFQLKLIKRKKIIHELVIGNLQSNSYDSAFLKDAFNDLKRRVRKTRCITMLSVAINEDCISDISKSIKNAGFSKTKKSIYFIVKPLQSKDADLLNPKLWSLYRSDIDTW